MNDDRKPSSSLRRPSSESSNSDDERGMMEHILRHGSPPDMDTVIIEDSNGIPINLSQSKPQASSSSSSENWITKLRSASASVMGSIRPSSSSSHDEHKKKPQQHQHWKAKVWSTWNNLKYSSTWMADRSDEYTGNTIVFLLGRCYFPNRAVEQCGFDEFCADYNSRIWITYRTNFPPLLDTPSTTDCGWGCMIRTTQMMLAQAILVKRLGRDWRYTKRKRSCVQGISTSQLELNETKRQELAILKLFEDNNSAPLGIHRFVSIAQREKGDKAIGSWYSPSEAVHIMKKCINESSSALLGNIAMVLAIDGKIHIRDIEIETRNWSKHLILVVVARLGASEINPVYVSHLKYIFSMERSLGVTGGKPNRSCWFIGCYDDHVIYLDPHVAHEYAPIDVDGPVVDGETSGGNKRAKNPEKSYHCQLLSKMHFLDMDPSCAICFSFETREQFDRDMKEMNLHQYIDIDQGEEDGMKRVNDPLFCVVYGERRVETYDETTATVAEKEQANRQGFELL
ncbi:unnamed protein product [Caenorhabditis bovis]|uniref:Cysteine protease n=1 Tax=Caenorhabditis bovis TaxID=2654633 RepID=A0A8S1EYG5_9PELO|nr:unnamed protein product [Caenorhabditis bovis]